MTGISRRTFVVRSLAGGGMLLGYGVLGGGGAGAAASAPADVAIGAWIRIGADESVTVLCGSSEMGQGVLSGLAQIVAEELKVDWAQVRAESAPAAAAYVNPAFGSQLTGGSLSVRGYYRPLRLAGAAAREMLISAAAIELGVPRSQLTAANGKVTVTGTATSRTYGQLASRASGLPVPSRRPLTPSSTFQLIGKPLPRTDLGPKVTGQAIYGIDVRVPGMVYAAIRHCPAVGGTLRSTSGTPARALAIVPLGNAVAAVANGTWEAMQAVRSLGVTWNIPAASRDVSSSQIMRDAQRLMSSGSAITAESVGDVDAALAAAAQVLDVTYALPYVAHGCMEPLSCTASVTPASCEIWAPTQGQSAAVQTAKAITGLPEDRISVQTTLLGGGLGRKFEQDFVAQAVQISKAVGRPVKLTWSREEDFGHDQYRPMALTRVRAGLDAQGNVVAWHNRIVSPSILGQRGWIGPGDVDSQAVDGATEQPYAFGTRRVEWVPHPSPVPVGFWRSVGNSINAFAVESAIDELALLARADPVAFRLRLLSADSRGRAVLRSVANLAGWSTPPAPGSARGVAFHRAFGSTVAQVAEVARASATTFRVTRMSCAIDCGQVINPDSVAAQMEGGIVHGLSAARWGRITFENGVADPVNFDDNRVTRMRDMPAISVNIIPRTTAPGGVGEPGVPCAAPALANAHFALTATRLRTLPLGI